MAHMDSSKFKGSDSQVGRLLDPPYDPKDCRRPVRAVECKVQYSLIWCNTLYDNGIP